MLTIHDLFDTLGGPGKVAEMMSIKPSTASEMKRRQSIPLKYWDRLIHASAAEGLEISYSTLVALHSKSKQPSEAA